MIINKKNHIFQFLGYASEVSLEIIKQLSNSDQNNDIRILSRPLGNVIYFMTSLISESNNIRRLEKKIYNCLVNA